MSGWLGLERITLDSCDSTNDEAARLAMFGAAHGTIVTADTQLTGRGRLGRRWFSPPGENLYLSCVLRPALEPMHAPPITLAAGVAVADAVAAFAVQSRLKWPNDVLCRGKKLAGILTEMSTQSGRISHVILGIGVNLATRAFPDDLADSATSLAREGIEVGRDAFLAKLLPILEIWLDRYFAGGISAIADAWMERAALTSGVTHVTVATAESTIVGRALGLDDQGALRVVDERGQLHHILTGDVMIMAPDKAR